MRIFLFAVVAAAVISANSAFAQQPAAPRIAALDPPATSLRVASPGEVIATPEMWFYEQAIRRQDDPAIRMREIAAQRGAERRARLAAMKWYGLSNSRPTASIDVVHGSYSPGWVGNGYNPYQWVGPAGTATVIVPAQR